MEVIQDFSPVFYTKFGTVWFNSYADVWPNVGLDDLGGIPIGYIHLRKQDVAMDTLSCIHKHKMVVAPFGLC